MNFSCLCRAYDVRGIYNVYNYTQASVGSELAKMDDDTNVKPDAEH